MAEVSQNLSLDKTLDPVCTIHRIPAGRVQFKNLRGPEFLNRLDQADIESFGIGILPDLLLPVLPLGKAFFQLIGTAAEHDDPVTGKQVGDVSLDKSIRGNEFRSPEINVDNPASRTSSSPVT